MHALLRNTRRLLPSLALLTACGSPTASRTLDQPHAAASRPRFTQDIQPVLEAKCSPCHSGDGPSLLPLFVNNEKVFLDNAEGVVSAIVSSNPLEKMPPFYSSKGPLNEDQKALILRYFARP